MQCYRFTGVTLELSVYDDALKTYYAPQSLLEKIVSSVSAAKGLNDKLGQGNYQIINLGVGVVDNDGAVYYRLNSDRAPVRYEGVQFPDELLNIKIPTT